MDRNKVYLWLQAALIVLTAILLSFAAVHIFREGFAWKSSGHPMDWIYTPEKAAEAFAPIAPLFFAAIGMAAAGMILGVSDHSSEEPVKDSELARNLMTARVAHPSSEMLKEQGLRKKYAWIGRAAAAVCAIPVLSYLSNSAHFDAAEFDVTGMLAHICPWIILAFAVLMVCARLKEESFLRETEAAKIRIAEEKADGTRITEENGAGTTAQNAGNPVLLRRILLAAAVILIIAGIFNGSMRDVLYKAINICTECVGLG